MGLSASAPWRAFYGSTPVTIDYPRKTMQQMVCDAAKKYPGNIAYTFMGKETTYAAFAKRIEAASPRMPPAQALVRPRSMRSWPLPWRTWSPWAPCVF